jgi:hypothetical protein
MMGSAKVAGCIGWRQPQSPHLLDHDQLGQHHRAVSRGQPICGQPWRRCRGFFRTTRHQSCAMQPTAANPRHPRAFWRGTTRNLHPSALQGERSGPNSSTLSYDARDNPGISVRALIKYSIPFPFRWEANSNYLPGWSWRSTDIKRKLVSCYCSADSNA